MPKTPDEMKKGLEYCAVSYTMCDDNCPYKEGCDGSNILKDALAYIQQLEAQDAELLEKVERLEVENDTLLNDLKDADMVECKHCKHYRINDPECSCECGTCINPCPCNECYHNNLWQWRGVKKEETP